jgi:hypothetical protein
MDSMRRFWVPGMPNIEADLDLTTSSWLQGANYYVVGVTSPGNFAIQFSSLEEVASLFAATSNRTFSGCFESIASVGEVERSPRSVAWLLVKLYYAAFFAAHGHMRACGISCTNLDALDAVRIYDAAKVYGALGSIQKISSGQYMMILDFTTLTLAFSAVTASGSHEALWHTYKLFIDRLIAGLPNLIPIQQQRNHVDNQLMLLRAILCFKGSNGGNWLSRFRNSVQYRHSHGAWYPYSLEKSTPPKLISRLISAFTEDPDIVSLSAHGNRPDDEVDIFYRCTMFLSAIARATTIDLATRSTNRKSAARRGAIAYLRLCNFD